MYLHLAMKILAIPSSLNYDTQPYVPYTALNE